MKGVVYEGPKKITVREVLDPKPAPDELLLKVFYCGICETDVWVYQTGQFARPGMILGHMGGGEVIEVGSEVDGWKVGERVAVDPRVYCGECLMCRGGHATMCQTRLEQGLGVWIGLDACRDKERQRPYHGLLAEYCAVPVYACYRIPDTISDHASAAVEGTAFSVRCIRSAGIRLGDNVVLFGGADYCLEWLQWARLVGARQVAVVEPIPVRREMAGRLGADVVIDPTTSDTVKEVRRLMPLGADVVGLYPTYPGCLQHAYEVVRPRGTIQILICYEDQNLHRAFPLTPVAKEITLFYPGLFEAEPWRGGRERGDYALAVELLAEKKIDVESYVTRIIPWEEVDRIAELGFARLPYQEVKVRVRIGGH